MQFLCFLYKTETRIYSIHPEHIGAFHQGNFNALSNFWEQNGANIDISDYMNYDPFLGRITEPADNQMDKTLLDLGTQPLVNNLFETKQESLDYSVSYEFCH